MADVNIFVLICRKCKTNAIRAPRGATEKTRYICKDCLKLEPGSGFVPVDFNRVYHPPVSRRIGRVEQSWWDRQCIANRARQHSNIDAEMAAVLELTQSQLETLLESAERDNPLFQKYSNQRWIRALCADNLMELQELERRCLVLVSIMGLSVKNAAQALHIRKETVEKSNLRAQRKLARKDITSVGKLYKTGNIKSCYVN